MSKDPIANDGGVSTAYGGVLIDRQGRVLLRRPHGEYYGYAWTFPKGQADSGESREAAAVREVLEETGWKARIVERIPGEFRGDGSLNHYYLMEPISSTGEFDDETVEIRWADQARAAALINQTRNPYGRPRDLAVLAGAFEVFGELAGNRHRDRETEE